LPITSSQLQYCPTNLTNPPTPSPHHHRPLAPPSACPHIIYTSTATLKSIMPWWRYYPENQRPSSSDWNRCLLHLLRSHSDSKVPCRLNGGRNKMNTVSPGEGDRRQRNTTNLIGWFDGGRWPSTGIRTNNTTTNLCNNRGEV
jgi:hypothetical protein